MNDSLLIRFSFDIEMRYSSPLEIAYAITTLASMTAQRHKIRHPPGSVGSSPAFSNSLDRSLDRSYTKFILGSSSTHLGRTYQTSMLVLRLLLSSYAPALTDRTLKACGLALSLGVYAQVSGSITLQLLHFIFGLLHRLVLLPIHQLHQVCLSTSTWPRLLSQQRGLLRLPLQRFCASSPARGLVWSREHLLNIKRSCELDHRKSRQILEAAVVKQIRMAATPNPASAASARTKATFYPNFSFFSTSNTIRPLHSTKHCSTTHQEPSTPEAANMSAINLAPREHQMLLAIGKYINTSAVRHASMSFTSVDWEALARDLEYKTAKAARDKWYPLRDKLFGKQAAGGGTNGASTPGSKKKATPTSRKRKNSYADMKIADDDATPSKKKTPKKASKNQPEFDEDDDEEKGKHAVVKPEPGSDEDEDGLELPTL
ncbi:uncharacterized protein MYCFIDRAFT_208907 [Pseudocercospora fijiensis CIRAD86]|uniref:Myb-like domain-containing protein n=1 Tax=Pseudocercospora fijiensis (strain CIRAD86) TaxID=383855 RepID=M2ZGJ4_PSEFD|nr:uncharacterized protein MYCFIDRAFT_208907 [Pseudocercospora fijiensis CIRAD86]EME78234.1 hypothetical protein MYCFIDRAFT_208907 [Pseudocercospora fijiensis CIRAD86]